MPSCWHSSASRHSFVSSSRSMPGGHSHLNEPIVLTHWPPSQSAGMASHSSISAPRDSFVITACSRHRIKNAIRYVIISIKMYNFVIRRNGGDTVPTHWPLWMLRRNPSSQSSLEGHCSHGWPQALPTVAQHSCLVHTTPCNWPWHMSLRTWVKHGPVL